MKIIILGCSNSFGVPVIGCNCKICKSSSPRNKRLRQSIYIEDDDVRILIDPGPDFRQQYIKNNIEKLDAILVTHPHEDHIGGFGDLRGISFISEKPVDVYMDAPTKEIILEKYSYIVNKFHTNKGNKSKILNIHEIKANQSFTINNLQITPFKQNHGAIDSLGFRINNFAYSTDFKTIDKENYSLLADLDLWVVEAMGYKNYPAHINLDEALQLIDKFRPKKSVLIHMSHSIDYSEISKKLPPNVIAAYDGMQITI